MKKIGVTYTMRNGKEKAETYIELPVYQEACEYLLMNMKCGYHYMRLIDTLRPLCSLQGYIFEEIEKIEEI